MGAFCRPMLVLSKGLGRVQVRNLKLGYTPIFTRFQGSNSRNYSGIPTPMCTTMKLDTPEFKNIFSPEMKTLKTIFDKYNHELRIAGGAVRDLLLGNQPHDLDFATTATPDEMKSMFNAESIRMINTKGEKHGTVTCRINDKENFEVTTLRIDVVTDGRHAEVQFTRNWELDALRRDLTINAMFLDFDGTLYDYFNGKDDLEARKVGFVGEAQDRIQEDYLRILRYFRFYGRISEKESVHEDKTLKAIRDHMGGLAGISGERIWVELKKIVTGNHANSLMRVMVELGMGKYVGLSQDPNLDEFDSVWGRCQHLQPVPMTLMASLMKEEQEVYTLHERLKLSRDELRTGVFIVNNRDIDLGQNPLRCVQDLMCDTVGKEPKTKDRICELLKYLGKPDILHTFTEWDLPKFPVNGRTLLEMGVPKGPSLAKALAALREKWKESTYSLSEKELLDFVEEIKQQIK